MPKATSKTKVTTVKVKRKMWQDVNPYTEIYTTCECRILCNVNLNDAESIMNYITDYDTESKIQMYKEVD